MAAVAGWPLSPVERTVVACREVKAAGGTPLVCADLDLTFCAPLLRGDMAAEHVEHAEVLPGLAALARQHRPALHEGAWEAFVGHHGLDQRYPDVDVMAIEAEFRSALAWTPEAVASDAIADGAVDFVAAVQAAGGRVVALTGRPRWLAEASRAHLDAAGLGSVDVVVAPRRCGESTASGKARAQDPALDGDVVAVFDDDHTNRASLRRRWPGALVCAVRWPGFGHDAAPGEPQISSFEVSSERGIVAAGVLA